MSRDARKVLIEELPRATVLLGLWLAAGREEPGSVRSLALAPLGAVTGVAAFCVLARSPPPYTALRRPPPAVGTRSASLVATAASEELVWRGFALGGLTLLGGPGAGLALSSLAFALWHWQPLRWRCVTHVITGGLFGTLVLATGSVVPAITSHSAYNLSILLAVGGDGNTIRRRRAAAE